MENLVALVITLLVLFFVGLPLLREGKQQEEVFVDEMDQDPEVDRLLSQKETALAAIRELEFDHAVGNLSDADYQELKEKYERRAISLLKTLDDVSQPGANGRAKSVKRARARRGERPAAESLTCPDCGEPYEEGDLFCASCGAALTNDEESSLCCPDCSEPYDTGDLFCASCGASLSAEQEDADSGEEDASAAQPAQAADGSSPLGAAYRGKRSRHGGRPRRAGANGRGAR